MAATGRREHTKTTDACVGPQITHTFDNAHTYMVALLHSRLHSERAAPHSLALALLCLLSCLLLLALELALVLALVLLVLSLAVSHSLALLAVSEQSCTRPTHLCKFSVCQIGLSMTIFAMRYRSIPMIACEINSRPLAGESGADSSLPPRNSLFPSHLLPSLYVYLRL